MANALRVRVGVLPGMTNRRSGAWVRWLLGAALAALVLVLMLGGDDAFDVAVVGALGLLTQWLAVALCWLAVRRAGYRRVELLLVGVAVAAFAAGVTYVVVVTVLGRTLSYPSPADIGYVAFYPLILAALAVRVSRRLRQMAWPVILDGALGSLGAAAVVAVLLDPILASAAEAPASLAAAVAVAYPLLDLVLVAAFVGIGASQGLDFGREWILLVLGLLIFAATDVVFGLLKMSDLYVVGTPLDAGWCIGLVLIAFWVDGSARSDTKRGASAWSIPAQAVPVIATAAGLGVLILGTQVPVSSLAVVLASLTLALMAVPMIFRQRIRLADAHAQARTDELTGLPNRRALYADVPVRLAAAQRRRSALLLLDLDKFKEVNDSLGHDVGDRLLVQVAARLTGRLRPGDLLARLGGDEFAIYLDNCGSDQAEDVAEKLRLALGEPFVLEGITLQSSASIGIAVYPDQGEDLTVLLRKADMAMYKAKTTRGGHHVYRSADDGHGEERLRTLEDLRLALHEDQLLLHYQPKIDLASGEVRGVEALVRWDHPVRGLLYPDAFLPLVEEAGLMHRMTQIVFEKALDQAALWQAQGRPMTVAVNISASSLIDAELPEWIGDMVAARNLSPSVLVLEITEDFLMADRDRARAILTRLRTTGIRISVDDFGTGYSSLAYLRDLPIDELKLDRSFIAPMSEDSRATALVASTIELAHSLGLSMVAEGVEDGVAYSDLAGFGCDIAQGFYMSRPVTAAALDHWLTTRPQGHISAPTGLQL